jgi:Uma2 family endonuclease
MVEAAVRMLDDDEIVLRKAGVRFPVELRPAGFDPDDLATWPDAVGRLEYVDGRLLHMPPWADIQQEVAVDVVHVLRTWVEEHREFVVGANEAGMKLGADIRAADAAVWLRAQVGPATGRLRHAPPVLAVEIAGADDDEPAMREKARWYLSHDVEIVWIIVPSTREVIVIGSNHEWRLHRGQPIPPTEKLPGLSPDVASFFVQLDRSTP